MAQIVPYATQDSEVSVKRKMIVSHNQEKPMCRSESYCSSVVLLGLCTP